MKSFQNLMCLYVAFTRALCVHNCARGCNVREQHWLCFLVNFVSLYPLRFLTSSSAGSHNTFPSNPCPHPSWSHQVSLQSEPCSYPLKQSSVAFTENTCFCGIFFCFLFFLQMLILTSSPPSSVLQLEIVFSFACSFLYFVYILGYSHSHQSCVGSTQILKHTKRKAALDNVI